MRVLVSGVVAFLTFLLALACSSDEGGGDTGERADPIGAGGAAAASGGGAAASGGPSTPGGPPSFGQAPVQPTLGMDLIVPEETCARADVTATRVVPTVMLLVDGSQSMMESCYPDELPQPDGGVDAAVVSADAGMDAGAQCDPLTSGQPSRWVALRDALGAPDGFVATLQDVVKFGLAVYGTAPTCPLPLGIVQPALGNARAIATGLPLFAPGITTPTGPALEEVVRLLPDPSQALDDPIGPQIIILATDGNPNSCSFDLTPTLEATVSAALMAQAKSQQLYVISVGNESSAAHLQELANIGAGLARDAIPGGEVYYPEDPVALAETLESLVGEAISCELSLEGKGVQMGKECLDSVVTLNGEPLECNGPDGWVLKSATLIELQGAACERLQSDVAAQLSANFPCDILVD